MLQQGEMYLKFLTQSDKKFCILCRFREHILLFVFLVVRNFQQ